MKNRKIKAAFFLYLDSRSVRFMKDKAGEFSCWECVFLKTVIRACQEIDFILKSELECMEEKMKKEKRKENMKNDKMFDTIRNWESDRRLIFERLRENCG